VRAWNYLLLRNAHAFKWWMTGLWCLLIAGSALHWWRLNWNWIPLLFVSVFAVVVAEAWAGWTRDRVIREHPLPVFLRRKLREAYPHLAAKDVDLVERGLRQYFVACNRSQRQFVAMPSKVVDAMWHEFILHTRAYKDWCDLALGRFLHHTPAEALGAHADRNNGLRRAWFWACRDESINPRNPTRLPLLFALDAKLGIEGGFHYVPDCSDIALKSDQGGDGAGGTFCGTSFSDGSSSGDSGGFGGADSSDGGSDGGDGGDGGGDGGGGCGGGD
jgi:hypothetical protein